MRPTNLERTQAVLAMVEKHRHEQEARYGEANMYAVDGTGPETRWLLPYTNRSAKHIEEDLRLDYEDFEDEAPVTWLHLIREEFAEVAKESQRDLLLTELVQLAALCVSWAERLLDPPLDLPPEGDLSSPAQR